MNFKRNLERLKRTFQIEFSYQRVIKGLMMSKKKYFFVEGFINELCHRAHLFLYHEISLNRVVMKCHLIQFDL